MSATPDKNLASAALAPDAADTTARLPLWRWMAEGLRAALFLRPRVALAAPHPWQLLLLAAVAFAAEIALSRLEVVGPAQFHLQAWLATPATLLAWVALAWGLRREAPDRPASFKVASAAALYLVATLPASAVYQSFIGAVAHGAIGPRWLVSQVALWSIAIAMLLWSLAVAVVLLGRFGGWRWRWGASALLFVGAVALLVWQAEGRSWTEDLSRDNATEERKPRLRLSQQTFEAQQRLLPAQLANLAPRRPGVTNVYGLVFAPYASEDVFLRESRMVGELLARRFDAQGRVLQLVNHASTTETHAWATPENLRRAIAGLAQRMDRERDLLVVYMTSHGASDFRLAAEHWPLEVEGLEPDQLRAALDEAGIRHRVIAISACFSGGWIAPLANEDSLVMTAADETHTSYGCGSRSELTFFGRAMFDEQLRQTHSFEQAFARAVPLIRQREIDAGKDDGFSNPQIKVGANIGPLLRALEQRLDALPPAPPAVAASAAGAAEKSPR